MTKDDIKFLTDLQQSLKSQKSGNPYPTYWVIIENTNALNKNGNDTAFKIDDKIIDFQGVIQYINEYVNNNCPDDVQDIWEKEIYKEDTDAVLHVADMLGIDIEEVSIRPTIAKGASCFLTKDAAIEYLNKHYDRHNRPSIISMSAVFNDELKRFLELFEEIDLKKLETNNYE